MHRNIEIAALIAIALIGLGIRLRGSAGVLDLAVSYFLSPIFSPGWSRGIAIAAVECALSVVVGMSAFTFAQARSAPSPVSATFGIVAGIALQVACFLPAALP